MNNAKKRILCTGFAILLIFLCGAAAATEADPTPIPLIQPTPLPLSFTGEEAHYTTVWKIVSPGINTDALLLETFGSADPEPQSEERENHSLFWPANAKGVPFCSIGHRLGAEDREAAGAFLPPVYHPRNGDRRLGLSLFPAAEPQCQARN